MEYKNECVCFFVCVCVEENESEKREWVWMVIILWRKQQNIFNSVAHTHTHSHKKKCKTFFMLVYCRLDNANIFHIYTHATNAFPICIDIHLNVYTTTQTVWYKIPALKLRNFTWIQYVTMSYIYINCTVKIYSLQRIASSEGRCAVLDAPSKIRCACNCDHTLLCARQWIK